MLSLPRIWLATVLTVAVAALAAPTSLPLLGDLLPALESIILPSRDNFYQGPANLGSYPVGAVIRSRQVPTQTSAAKAYQIMYRTTDQLGQPQYGLTTTLVPARPQSPIRLISYQAFEDSTALDCATSFALLPNTTSANVALSGSTNPIANVLLSFGYTVTIPDFLGPKSAFIVGKQQGQAVLDGIRATLNHAETIPKRDGVRTAIMGYNGGASATAWAAQLQPNYASELNFVGATYGGLPVSPLNVLNKLDGMPNAGLSLAGIVGMANAYPAPETYVQSKLNAQGRKMIQALRSGQVCLAQLSAQFANTKIANFFNGFTTTQEPVPSILKENTLGASITQMPQYIFQGLADEIMPVPDVDAYVASQCKGGARISYSRDRNASHTFEIGDSVLGALTWVDTRFSGLFPVLPAGGCVTRTQDVNQGPPLFASATKSNQKTDQRVAGQQTQASGVDPQVAFYESVAAKFQKAFGSQALSALKDSLPWA